MRDMEYLQIHIGIQIVKDRMRDINSGREGLTGGPKTLKV